MILLPAIDILDGKPVRLVQGDYGRASQVAASVPETAAEFERKGAEWIHMVDLDGAKAGHPVNLDLIAETARSVNIPVEAGGGFRTMEDIERALEGGISRVILGTSALQDEALLKEALARYGERIAVGMDCRNGKVSVAGWLQDSEMDYLDFARKMEALGVQTLIVTDISRDGTLGGPALAMMEAVSNACGINLVASGGVKDLGSIEDLAALNLYGAIAGKALYAGTLDLQQAIEAGRKTGTGLGESAEPEASC